MADKKDSDEANKGNMVVGSRKLVKEEVNVEKPKEEAKDTPQEVKTDETISLKKALDDEAEEIRRILNDKVSSIGEETKKKLDELAERLEEIASKQEEAIKKEETKMVEDKREVEVETKTVEEKKPEVEEKVEQKIEKEITKEVDAMTPEEIDEQVRKIFASKEDELAKKIISKYEREKERTEKINKLISIMGYEGKKEKEERELLSEMSDSALDRQLAMAEDLAKRLAEKEEEFKSLTTRPKAVLTVKQTMSKPVSEMTDEEKNAFLKEHLRRKRHLGYNPR